MPIRIFFTRLFVILLSVIIPYSMSAIARSGGGAFQIHRELQKPHYKNQSGNFKLYFGGYTQGDIMKLDNAPQLHGITHWREARLSVGIDLFKDWQLEGTYNFANSLLYNAYLHYTGWSHFTWRIGQYSPVFGLSNTIYVPALTLLELALPVFVFSPPYMPGVQFGIIEDPFTIYASLLGPRLGTTVHGKNPYAGMLSIAFAPLHSMRRVLMLSLSGWQQGTDSFHTIDFSSVPEVEAKNQGSLVDTGNVGNVKNSQLLNASAAIVYGSFSVQSEYIRTWVNRINRFPRLRFSGYYIIMSYFLTGESRHYSFKEASFLGISPIQHWFGALQIALRYSHLNLMSVNVQGGEEQNITVGLNWYVTKHVRFLFNYIRAIATPNSDGFNQTANIYAFRAQLLF